MNESKTETRTKQEETPTMIIKAPLNYDRTHELTECPIYNSPNPVLDMYMQVRELVF